MIKELLEEVAKETKVSRKPSIKKIPDKRLPQRLKIGTAYDKKKDKIIKAVFLPQWPSLTVIAAAGDFTQTGSLLTQEIKKKYPAYFIHRPIPHSNVREMTDPYNQVTRNQFTDCAINDPTAVAALRKRNEAFFRKGLTLKLRLKNKRSELDGHTLTDEEMEILSAGAYMQYKEQLTKLDTWIEKEDISLLRKLKSSHFVGVVQGRSLMKFFPPLEYLEHGELPVTLKVISSEEMGNVIIDRMTEQIIALRIFSVDEENFTLLPDEMVYTYLHDSALTRYERFYGRSQLETIVQLSRINTHIRFVGYAEAFEAAYLPKILFQMPVEGKAEDKEKILAEKAKAIANSGSDIIAMESSEHSNIQAIPQDAKHEMVQAIIKDIDEVMLGVLGSTKSQISRTENLTRDNATIMEIENERNVKVPDEKAFAKPVETQLLNPLFAHLCGLPIDQLPVEVYLEPILDEEDLQTKLGQQEQGQPGMQSGVEQQQQNLEQDKKGAINGQQMRQKDDKGMGASGKKRWWKKSEPSD